MPRHSKRRRVTGLLLVILILLVVNSQPYRDLISFPSELKVAEGQPLELNFHLPYLYVRPDRDGIIALEGGLKQGSNWKVLWNSPLSLQPVQLGEVNLEFRLFGIIPWKRVAVDVLPEVRLVPGGQSIGILLKTNGIVVTSLGTVIDPAGVEHHPAQDAGVEVGDVIVKVNDREVKSDEEMAFFINEAGQKGNPVILEIRRRGSTLYKMVKPVFCRDAGRFRIGLFVRDGTAGVGTLTFYDPKTLVFGALGHVITDVDSNQRLEVREGNIVMARVTSVEKARGGQPGEKIGVFDDRTLAGSIQANSDYGIFGRLSIPPPDSSSSLPIALAGQVRTGTAEIMTVVQGDKVERFAIEIQRVFPQDSPETKGMIIKITDSRLLAKTGGIVQGMSGSPILQDGRLVGAVTHVFVNDPTRGYGVFIEWMVWQSGILRQTGVRCQPDSFFVGRIGDFCEKFSCRSSRNWKESNQLSSNSFRDFNEGVF